MLTDDILIQHKWKKFNEMWQKNGVELKIDNNQRKVYLHSIINEDEKIRLNFYHEFNAFGSDISKLENDITRGIFKILYEDSNCKNKITPKIKRAFCNWIQ